MEKTLLSTEFYVFMPPAFEFNRNLIEGQKNCSEYLVESNPLTKKSKKKVFESFSKNLHEKLLKMKF